MLKEQFGSYIVEFFCVNDRKNVDVKYPQTMRCIFCYSSPILVCNSKAQARKGLILYNTTNGITTFKKHVNANHFIIAKKFEKEVNSPLKKEVGKQPTKKKSSAFG
jgi:hypothetical protein